jgi:23S rRNA (cytidine2498-2'-O)-methyltransferase
MGCRQSSCEEVGGFSLFQLSHKKNHVAYLAPLGLESLFSDILGSSFASKKRLFWGPKNEGKHEFLSLWAANVWEELQEVTFDSISDCAKALTSLQRNWALYEGEPSSRALYIQKALPHVSAKPLIFAAVPKKEYPPLGAWMLLDDRHALLSSRCTSPRPNGEWNFEEDRVRPPNRAYLKLWETFTRMGVYPKSGEICLDLGASPGGWTWVLHELGSHIKAFDRSPLREDLQTSSRVEYIEADAFRVDLGLYLEATWLFCDVICYPEKLYEWVISHVLPSSIRYAVCTLKFQGRDHYGVIDAFQKIPGSSLVHLTANKHELTWVYNRA